MAFTFDSTISGTTANSYISVTQADDFFTAHLDQEYWTNLSTSKKQAALVQATNRIDQEQFGGRRTIDAQRLQWPRTFIISRDKTPKSEEVAEFIGGAYYRPSNEIYKELIEATCEMALYLIKMNQGEFTVDEFDLQTLSKYKVGPLDVSIKDGYRVDVLPFKVANLLHSIGPNAWNGGSPLRYER